RDLWPGLPGDRLDFPGGLEPLLRALAAVPPLRAALVGAAGPSESGQGGCHGALRFDLGALLGETFVRAIRPVGPGHAGVVLSRRPPADSDIRLPRLTRVKKPPPPACRDSAGVGFTEQAGAAELAAVEALDV